MGVARVSGYGHWVQVMMFVRTAPLFGGGMEADFHLVTGPERCGSKNLLFFSVSIAKSTATTGEQQTVLIALFKHNHQ